MSGFNKKGQVTFFVILGLILVLLVILFLTLKGYILEDTYTSLKSSLTQLPAEFQPAKNLIEECIQNKAEDAIEYAGLYGGYYTPPTLSSVISVPYYVYNGTNKMPSKSIWEETISKYLEEELEYCIMGQELEGFTFGARKAKASTSISAEKVFLTIDFPVYIAKDEKTYIIRDFKEEIPVRLGAIYLFCDEFSKSEAENSQGMCLSCLTNSAEKYDLNVDMLSHENEVLFTVTDKENKINGKEFEFRFTNSYT